MNPAWLLILIPGVGFLVFGLLLWSGAKERRTAEATLASIRALSDADAEHLAILLLARPDLFQTRPASGPIRHPALPPSVLSLFGRFEEVVSGEFFVSTDSIQPSERLPGYLKIGEDSEFTEILVKPGSSRLFVLPGEGPGLPVEEEPSIWHELIIVSGVPFP